jgi:hypothetical protein
MENRDEKDRRALEARLTSEPVPIASLPTGAERHAIIAVLPGGEVQFEDA